MNWVPNHNTQPYSREREKTHCRHHSYLGHMNTGTASELQSTTQIQLNIIPSSLGNFDPLLCRAISLDALSCLSASDGDERPQTSQLAKMLAQYIQSSLYMSIVGKCSIRVRTFYGGIAVEAKTFQAPRKFSHMPRPAFVGFESGQEIFV